MHMKFVGLAALAAAIVVPGVAFAEGNPFLCTLSTLQSCDEAGGCNRITHDEANFPRFLEVDIDKRVVSGTRPDGSSGTTAIRALYSSLDKALLHGAEGGRSWSATITDSGGFNVVVTSEDFTMVGFGACTATGEGA